MQARALPAHGRQCPRFSTSAPPKRQRAAARAVGRVVARVAASAAGVLAPSPSPLVEPPRALPPSRCLRATPIEWRPCSAPHAGKRVPPPRRSLVRVPGQRLSVTIQGIVRPSGQPPAPCPPTPAPAPLKYWGGRPLVRAAATTAASLPDTHAVAAGAAAAAAAPATAAGCAAWLVGCCC